MLKKLIAPIIVTVFTIAFLLFYFGLIFVLIPLSVVLRLLIGLIPLCLAGVSVFVLVERIKEVRSGEKMILVTTEAIPGKDFEALGMVKGNTIQTKNVGRDITQGFKHLVGGELKAYTEMMNEARALATKRMVEEAEALGADAVVCVRYASTEVMSGAAEIMAYGTAVKFK